MTAHAVRTTACSSTTMMPSFLSPPRCWPQPKDDTGPGPHRQPFTLRSDPTCSLRPRIRRFLQSIRQNRLRCALIRLRPHHCGCSLYFLHNGAFPPAVLSNPLTPVRSRPSRSPRMYNKCCPSPQRVSSAFLAAPFTSAPQYHNNVVPRFALLCLDPLVQPPYTSTTRYPSGHLELNVGYTIGVPKFSSEPWFEPRTVRTEPRFRFSSVQFNLLGRRFWFWFSASGYVPNLVRTRFEPEPY